MANEWCEFDDIPLQWDGDNGEKSNVRVAIEGKGPREQIRPVLKEWHDGRAGNVRLQGNTDRPHILVIGPPCVWRVDRIEGSKGYTLDQDTATEYSPNQSVVFTLTKEE